MKSVGKVFAADLNREIEVYAKTGETPQDAMKRVEMAHAKGKASPNDSFSISKGHIKPKGGDKHES